MFESVLCGLAGMRCVLRANCAGQYCRAWPANRSAGRAK